MKFAYHPRALAEVRHEAMWYARRDPKLADAFQQLIEETVLAKPCVDGLALEFGFGVGLARHAMPIFTRCFASRAPNWFAYDPLCPEPRQRNVVLSLRLLRSTNPPLYGQLYEEMDLAGRDQIRALLCDGPSLLAWVGAFQPTAYDRRQRRLLSAVLPALRRRLILERHIARLPRTVGALATTLEWLGAAAFTSACVASFTRPTRQVARASARWQLTPRQAEILPLVAKGVSNRTLAATLGIAERTVEFHLCAIFDKAGVESRAALVALVLGMN